MLNDKERETVLFPSFLFYYFQIENPTGVLFLFLLLTDLKDLWYSRREEVRV